MIRVGLCQFFSASYKQRPIMGNHWSNTISVNDLSKEELIELVEQICQNDDVDIMTQDKWQDTSVEQLRTIVVLLDDDMLGILDARRRRSVTTSPYAGCSLLKSLYDYTKDFSKWIRATNTTCHNKSPASTNCCSVYGNVNSR